MDGDGALRAAVCIAGAGPAGLVIALLLQDSQVPCIVLERLSLESFGLRAGAGMIEHRTVPLLDKHGLAEPILAHRAHNTACEFLVDGRSYALEYGELTGARGHCICPQHELVQALTELSGFPLRAARSASASQ